MKISVLSFSYKRGLPEDASGNGGGFVFDCRAMPNPFWDESLRGFSGCDQPIVDFFGSVTSSALFLAQIFVTMSALCDAKLLHAAVRSSQNLRHTRRR